MQKRLYRSRNSRMIGGVCSGIGEYFQIDPVIARAIFIIMTIPYGIGFFAYIILWIIVPERSKIFLDDTHTIYRENIDDQADDSIENNDTGSKKMILGIFLVAIGILFFLDNFLPTLEWSYIAPLSLILFGAWIIYRQANSRTKQRSFGEHHESI